MRIVFDPVQQQHIHWDWKTATKRFDQYFVCRRKAFNKWGDHTLAPDKSDHFSMTFLTPLTPAKPRSWILKIRSAITRECIALEMSITISSDPEDSNQSDEQSIRCQSDEDNNQSIRWRQQSINPMSIKISSDPEDSNQSDCFSNQSETIRNNPKQADATDAAALGRAPQGSRAMVVVCFCQTPLAHENCRKAYKSHCQQIIIVWMNDEFSLIIIARYQTCPLLMLSVISALHHVPLFMDRIWLLLVPVEVEVDPHTANKVCSDSTRNEQVKTSVCLIKFNGSSANVTLFSSREILLFLEWFWQKLWMSSSTLVPVYQYIGLLFASISSINHAHYILRLINVSTTVTW